MKFSLFFQFLTVLLPWPLRRLVLARMYGYRIHPSCSIGLSWVFPQELAMGESARIGHLTICKGLKRVEMGPHARIGHLNWITGFPQDSRDFFAHRTDRKAELLVGEHAAITHRHYIDCTDQVSIGRFSTLAGSHSKILTHSIDLEANRQTCQPISLGAYCFVGTNCVILGGARLADYCVLAAGAVLTGACAEPYRLYGGVPARAIKDLPENWAYFKREVGFVV